MDKRRQKTKLNDENRRAKRQNEIPLATEPEPTEMEIDQNHENSENPEIQEIRLEDLTDLENLLIPPPPEPPMNFDGTGPRLLITHIVNENFKSYAGRQIIGPFHKNFTSIVGPNGSGKSNVIDSILFVFGYRAQKIRSKKISVLIHNSDSHPDLDSCTVEVHFIKGVDKTDHEYEEVPGSGFVVSRTAFKDNSSEYRLNGKRVQFKQLAVLLRVQGIDLDHNRFLILQGEVEQIALMKPKAVQEGDEGMLEYLEDIIGSSRLVPFIDRLNRKLDEISEVRTEKLNRVKAVESEKSDLEGAKNEAIDYLVLENSIINKKFALFHVHRLEAADNCQSIAKERDAMKEEYEEHQNFLDETGKTIKEKKQNFDDAKKKLEECSTKIEKIQEKFRSMENEDTKLRADFGHHKKKLKELPVQIENEKKKLNDLKSQPARAEKQVEELTKNIEQLEKKKPGLEKNLQEATSKLRDDTKDLQASKEKAEKELVQYQKNLNEAREKVAMAQSELDICLNPQKNETKKLEEYKNSLKNVSETLSTRKKTSTTSETQLTAVTKNFEASQRRLRQTTVELTTCEEEVRNNRSKVDEARSKMQMSHSRGRVLDAIMQQKREGRIQGIIGRLGDLGAIDEKYDVAISTACGPLDNIVVDTIDTAQRCVEFLKRGNVGLATFLALDKQSGLIDVMRRPFDSPDGAPRLFDLIRVEDENVLPAFYYALGNTLVADNLEQATRIGLQGRTRHRVVTLDGKLIDTSGTMSGGGTQQTRGRMGRQVVTSPAVQISPEQLQRLDDQYKDRLNRLNELRKEKIDLENELHNYGRESTRLQSELDKIQFDIQALTEQESSLKKQIAAQEKIIEKTIPDATTQASLEKKVDKLQKEFDKVNAEPAKLQKIIDNFHKQIMDVHEKTVGTIQKQLDACQRELEDCRKNITKATVSIKSAERNVSKTEEKIQNLQEELDDHEKLSSTIRDRLKQLENEGIEITNEHDAAEADAQILREDCKNLKIQYDQLEEKEQQLNAAGMDKKQRLDHAEKTFKEFLQKKSYWEKEIKKLKLNDLSDLKPLVSDKAANADEDDDDDDEEEGEGEGQKKLDVEPKTSMDDRFDLIDLLPPSEEELRKIDKQILITKVTMSEDQLKAMKPNLTAIAEYRKKMEKFKECIRQLDEVTMIRDKIRLKHDELKKRRLNEFLSGFSVIATNLKEMYQMITLGGDADLELVDTMDPFSEGINFSVRPPKKSWKQISNLSGGEKTLSSLALVFALHHYKPTPLYVMDEIDAALDFRNVSIVANYIKERTKNAQFIIISLRNNMFELSDRLIGIYKTYNCTKSVTVDPGKISMPVTSMTKIGAKDHCGDEEDGGSYRSVSAVS